MKYRINRQLIRQCDVGFSSDVGVFPFLEKWTINGLWKAMTDLKQKLPTHVFLFVSVLGHLRILEMVVDKNDHRKMKLTLTSISKYESNLLGPRIICIKRNALYDDVQLRIQANARHLARWAADETVYDKKELARYLKLPVYNDPKKYVCSSETEDELNKDGYTYTGFPLLHTPQNLISPWDIMQAKYVKNLQGNRFDFYPLENIYI